MLLVDTYLAPSAIHGIGVFTKEFIPQGAKVWEFTPGFDQIFSDEDLTKLTQLQREAIYFYAYRSDINQQLVLCCDNARHYNFLPNPNCGDQENQAPDDFSSYALRDIQVGEELTYSIDDDLDAGRKLGKEMLVQLMTQAT